MKLEDLCFAPFINIPNERYAKQISSFIGCKFHIKGIDGFLYEIKNINRLQSMGSYVIYVFLDKNLYHTNMDKRYVRIYQVHPDLIKVIRTSKLERLTND